MGEARVSVEWTGGDATKGKEMIEGFQATSDSHLLTMTDPTEEHSVPSSVRKFPWNKEELAKKERDVIPVPGKYLPEVLHRH